MQIVVNQFTSLLCSILSDCNEVNNIISYTNQGGSSDSDLQPVIVVEVTGHHRVIIYSMLGTYTATMHRPLFWQGII